MRVCECDKGKVLVMVFYCFPVRVPFPYSIILYFFFIKEKRFPFFIRYSSAKFDFKRMRSCVFMTHLILLLLCNSICFSVLFFFIFFRFRFAATASMFNNTIGFPKLKGKVSSQKGWTHHTVTVRKTVQGNLNFQKFYRICCRWHMNPSKSFIK